jgi:glycosyltransferase involved in cell wall biosynthesis
MPGPRRPLRVAYLDHCAQLSGGEIALVRMVEALHGDVEAHVLLGEDGPIIAQLEAAGARVDVLAMATELRDTRKDTVTPGAIGPRAAGDLGRYVRSVTRRLREIRPDVVHTNSLKAAIYGGAAARAARLPVLWHIRDRIAPDYLPVPAVWLMRSLSLVVPSAVVANSMATARTLPRRSTVVYDVVPNTTRPSARGRSSDRPLVVGMLGRLAPWKGQHVFLEAFAAAHRGAAVEARLIGSAMFGEDQYEHQLHSLVDRLGIREQVDFRGFRDDVWAELAQLDVLVHASITPEPFGQVVIEGMAAGLPVVAAAAGGPAEVVRHENDGLLVPPGDVAGLAAAFERLAADPMLRASLAAAGLRTSGRYRPDAVARDMLSVYARLC